MSGVLWSKFFWSDWDNDPALKLCSLTAQGLWMRMLCIAARHNPVGYVANQGKPLDAAGIAKIIGVPQTDVENGLVELEQNDVFSRDRFGRIYSRRMLHDTKKRVVAQQNGKLGGNPNLSKHDRNPASDNPTHNPPLARARGIAQARAASASASDSDSNDSRKEETNQEEVLADDQKPNGQHQSKNDAKPKRSKKTHVLVREALETVLSASMADAVIQHRNVTIRKPLSAYGAEQLAKHFSEARAVAGLTADQAANFMIEHGWQGFEPEWAIPRTPQPTSRSPPVRTFDDEMQEIIERERAKERRNAR